MILDFKDLDITPGVYNSLTVVSKPKEKPRFFVNGRCISHAPKFKPPKSKFHN